MSLHNVKLKGFISAQHIKMIEKILELTSDNASRISVSYSGGHEVTFRTFMFSDWDWKKFSEWFEHIHIRGGGGFFSIGYVEVTVSGFKEPKPEEVK